MELSKMINLDFGYFQMCRFLSNLVSCFWRENSNVLEITKESLTFEKTLPLLCLKMWKLVLKQATRSSKTQKVFELNVQIHSNSNSMNCKFEKLEIN